MDNLTHSLVGLFLARAGFGRATPRGTAILVLAANIPDFDGISLLGGRAAYLHWHRNITHSLLAAPLMALLAAALVRFVGRKPVRWLNAWLIALAGIASHLILDLTMVYGVRLFLPFSGRWFHLDTTPLIDLTIWAILLLGVAAPALGRLVGSEIGERSRGGAAAGWAVFALCLLAAYDYGRGVLHSRAVTEMDSHTYNGLTPRRVGAFPTGNPLKWIGAAELSDAFVLAPVDLRRSYHDSDAEIFYKAQRTPAVDAAMATHPFQVLLEFVQWPLWVVEPAGDLERGTNVTLLDLRFGTPHEAGFAATAQVDERNRVVQSQFGMGGFRVR